MGYRALGGRVVIFWLRMGVVMVWVFRWVFPRVLPMNLGWVEG